MQDILPTARFSRRFISADYLDLRDRRRRRPLLIRSADFLSCTCPIPHPGWHLQSPAQPSPPARSTYIDNLALADEYLAHLRSHTSNNAATGTPPPSSSWETTPGVPNYVVVNHHHGPPEDITPVDGGSLTTARLSLKLPHQQEHLPASTRPTPPFAPIALRRHLDHRIRSPATWLTGWAAKSRDKSLTREASPGLRTRSPNG